MKLVIDHLDFNDGAVRITAWGETAAVVKALMFDSSTANPCLIVPDKRKEQDDGA